MLPHAAIVEFLTTKHQKYKETGRTHPTSVPLETPLSPTEIFPAKLRITKLIS